MAIGLRNHLIFISTAPLKERYSVTLVLRFCEYRCAHVSPFDFLAVFTVTVALCPPDQDCVYNRVEIHLLRRIIIQRN